MYGYHLDIHIDYERTSNNPAQRGTNYEGTFVPISRLRTLLRTFEGTFVQFSFRDSYLRYTGIRTGISVLDF